MVFSNFSCTKSSNQILFKNTIPIQNIGTIKLYSDDSTGTFTSKEFRWSYNNNYWSSWESLNQGNITRINTSNYQNLYLEVRYLFTSADANANSFLINYVKSSQTLSTQSYDDEVITLQKPLTNAELLESKKGSYYLDRANHKGEQPISSIINLNKTLTNYSNYINNNTSWQQSIDASVINLKSYVDGSLSNIDTSLGNLSRWEVIQDSSISNLRNYIDGSINQIDSSIDDIYHIIKPIINIDSSTINIDASGNIQLLFNQYHYYRQTIGETTVGDVRFYIDASSYYIDMLTSLSPETWTPKWIVKSVNGNLPDSSGNIVVSGGSGSVSSVNDILPDASGNVEVPIPPEYDDTELRLLAKTEMVGFACSDMSSSLTIDTSVGRMPILFDCSLADVWINVTTPPQGSSIICDIKKNGVSIFSNLISIDASEYNSKDATSPYVLSTIPTTFVIGDIITLDITQVGAVTAGVGLDCILKLIKL